ncbi:MAG: hypothetical protein O7B23_10755 [Deltaproteobacteria bacterium]|nr:hypothetical protein [Deltaproteobacteria bacterium]
MPKFFDVETRELVTGTPEELKALYLEERVGTNSGETVKVVSPEGKIVDAPGTSLRGLFELGYTLPTVEAEAHKNRVEAADTAAGMVATTIHEGVNEVTFGGSDFLGSQVFGEEYTKTRQAEREANPNLAVAAQLGAAVGTAIITGGASAVAKGGAKATASLASKVLAYTPAGLATRAAVTIEGSIASTLARNTIRRKAVSTAAASAVEGAFYEAGHEAGNIGLDNTERSGVEVLAAIGDAFGTGFVVGGVAGGVIGMISGGRHARRAVREDGDVIEAAAGEAGVAARKAIEDPIGGIGARLHAKGTKISAEDPSLSSKARELIEGDTRLPQERWNNGFNVMREGDLRQAEFATGLGDDLGAMAKADDAFLGKIEVTNNEGIYERAMADAPLTPAAPMGQIKESIGEFTNDISERVRAAGADVRREAVKPKAAKKVVRLEADVASRASRLGKIETDIGKVEKKLAKIRERAATTGRAAKTRGIEANLRRLSDDAVESRKALDKAQVVLNKAQDLNPQGLKKSELRLAGDENLPRGAAVDYREGIRILNRIEKSVAGADTQAAAMARTEELLRELGRVAKNAKEPGARALLRDAHADGVAMLNNDKLFGGAALVHEPAAASWTARYGSDDAWDLLMLPNKGDRAVDPFDRLGLPDAGKIDTITKQAGRRINDTNESRLFKAIDARENFYEQQMRLNPESRALGETALKHLRSARENLTAPIRNRGDGSIMIRALNEKQQSLGLKDSVEAKVNQGSSVVAPIAFGLGSIGGAVIGGPLGSLGGIGFMMGTLAKNRAGIVAQLGDSATVQSILGVTREKGRKAISGGISGFVGKMAKGTIGLGSGTISKRSRRAIPHAARGVARNEDEDRFVYAIRTTQSYPMNPEQALTNMVNRLGRVPKEAPMAAGSMVATVQKGAEFLNQKLPPIPAAPTFGKDDEVKRLEAIPVSEKLKFMRYYDTVNDPVGFFMGLQDGEVTAEGVEALREVYGRLHQQLTAEITAGLGDVSLSRPMQALLSTVLDINANRTFEGGFISNIQQNVAAVSGEAEQRSNQTVSPSRASPPSSDFAESFATRSQQIAGNAR